MVTEEAAVGVAVHRPGARQRATPRPGAPACRILKKLVV
jgi:hypothetical protein